MTPCKNTYGIFTQPIDQIYECQDEILNISLDLSQTYDCFSKDEEDYFREHSSKVEEDSLNIFDRKNFTKNRLKRKNKSKIKFKYILQPKWEETISKMKTLWFIYAKNKILSSYFNTLHNDQKSILMTKEIDGEGGNFQVGN